MKRREFIAGLLAVPAAAAIAPRAAAKAAERESTFKGVESTSVLERADMPMYQQCCFLDGLTARGIQ